MDKSGHIMPFIYGLIIGLKPEKDMLQIGTMLSSKVKIHL